MIASWMTSAAPVPAMALPTINALEFGAAAHRAESAAMFVSK